MSCKHFNRDDERGLTCSAFPEGIPPEIIHNQFDHRYPKNGDNGIRYEPIAEGEPDPDPFDD
jgi:hypothetical protein